MVWKVAKCLILVGFIEVGIEVDFWVELRWNTSETLILQGVCGLNRYAVLGFRLSVLKCKPRPLMTWKYTIIVQYYGMFFCWSIVWAAAVVPVCYIISQYDISIIDIRFGMCLSHKDKTKILSVTQRHNLSITHKQIAKNVRTTRTLFPVLLYWYKINVQFITASYSNSFYITKS